MKNDHLTKKIFILVDGLDILNHKISKKRKRGENTKIKEKMRKNKII